MSDYPFLAGAVGIAPTYMLHRCGRHQQAEHFQNKVSTAAGLTLATALPAAAMVAVKKNPEKALKIATKTGAGIEKAAKYIAEKAPALVSKIKGSKVGSTVINKAEKAAEKVMSTSAGKSFASKITGAFKKFAALPAVKKAVNYVSSAVSKFAKAPTATKGKYALLAAGIGLGAYVVGKLVTNYYRKEGAIDQKYYDMRKFQEIV